MVACGHDLPMRVEISVAQSTVKNNEEFSLSTTIRNVSKNEQSLQIWSCSYPDQWSADNPAVHITGASCDKNDIIRIRVKPGEAHERTLSIRVSIDAEHSAQKTVTFRLAFEPVTSEKTGIASRIWSNVITLNVTGRGNNGCLFDDHSRALCLRPDIIAVAPYCVTRAGIATAFQTAFSLLHDSNAYASLFEYTHGGAPQSLTNATGATAVRLRPSPVSLLVAKKKRSATRLQHCL